MYCLKISTQNFVCQTIGLGHKILIWNPEGSSFLIKMLIFSYSLLQVWNTSVPFFFFAERWLNKAFMEVKIE